MSLATSNNPLLNPLIWLLFALVAAIIVPTVVYWPGLTGPFILDDFLNIDRLAIKSLSFDTLVNAMLNNHSGMLGRSVSALALTLTGYVSNMDPEAFKYHNLMTHLITGLLLIWLTFRILCHLLGSANRNQAAMIAIGAGALWMAHPLLVSTVLYAVQRMAILASMFMVAGMLVYVIGRERLAQGRRSGLPTMVIALVVFGPLALFSKENGALLPLFILAIEACIYRFQMPTVNGRKWLRLYHVVLIGLPMLIGLIMFFVKYDSFMGGYESRDFTLAERLYTQAQVIFYYLYLIIAPRLTEMSIYQDGFLKVEHFDLVTAIAVTVIAGLLAFAWQFRQKTPVLSLAILWFFIAHLVESTIFPLELAFEHRNYLAAYGVTLALCYYLLKSYRAGWQPYVYQGVLFFTILGFLGNMTYERAKIWQTFQDIVFHSYEYQPFSGRAASDMATIQIVTGDTEKAQYILKKAYHYFPNRRLGTVLHTMWAFCNERGIPPNLFSEVLHRLSHDTNNAYSIAAYERLQTYFSKHECPAMSPRHFDLMSDALMRNPGAAPGGDFAYWARMFRGNALMYLGYYHRAMALYDDAYASFDDPFSHLAILMLVEKYRWQVNVGKFDDAEETLARLELISSRRPVPIDEQLADLRGKLEWIKQHPERIQPLR